MGTSQSDVSAIGTAKGEGYRIISLRNNSPLDGKIDIFFDFIIDAISEKEPERTPQDILNKLTDGQREAPKQTKTLDTFLKENENVGVTLKVVSTKFRNVRNVEVLFNSNWNGTDDILGFESRI
jgi:hypothetical protein